MVASTTILLATLASSVRVLQSLHRDALLFARLLSTHSTRLPAQCRTRTAINNRQSEPYRHAKYVTDAKQEMHHRPSKKIKKSKNQKT